jgi:sugar/nucleoside kinase (ribokinase family)
MSNPPSGGELPRLEVLVMGSLFVELTPAEGGSSLEEMKALVPLASGAAGNFALALSALGARVGMLGSVGRDELGEWVLARMEEEGVDTSSVRRHAEQLTPLSLASADLSGGKTFRFYRFPGYSDPLAAMAAEEIGEEEVGRARIFDFTEAVVRSPGVRRAAFRAAELAREAGAEVVYGVNWRPGSWRVSGEEARQVQREALARADLAVMNEEEYELIYGGGGEGAPRPRKLLVVTAGGAGGWYEREAERFSFRAPQVEVRYDVGAGDTFHAGLVAAWLRGEEPEEVVRFAASCAALKISQSPAEPPPSGEAVREFQESYGR